MFKAGDIVFLLSNLDEERIKYNLEPIIDILPSYFLSVPFTIEGIPSEKTVRLEANYLNFEEEFISKMKESKFKHKNGLSAFLFPVKALHISTHKKVLLYHLLTSYEL